MFNEEPTTYLVEMFDGNKYIVRDRRRRIGGGWYKELHRDIIAHANFVYDTTENKIVKHRYPIGNFVEFSGKLLQFELSPEISHEKMLDIYAEKLRIMRY